MVDPRALVIVPGGLIVVPAIWSGGLTCLAYDLLFYTVRSRDILGYAAFIGLATVFMVICFRASLRMRRQASDGDGRNVYEWMAYLAPFLMVPGLLGGIVAGVDISEEVRESRQADAQSTCQELFTTPGPDCVALALDCAQEIYRQDLKLGWRKTEQLEHACVQERAPAAWK